MRAIPPHRRLPFCLVSDMKYTITGSVEFGHGFFAAKVRKEPKPGQTEKDIAASAIRANKLQLMRLREAEERAEYEGGRSPHDHIDDILS